MEKIGGRGGWAFFMGFLLAANFGWAGERHFIYNYETDVLGSGIRELETYTTYSFGRDHYFSGLLERMEYEMGLGDGIQTSLYLNFEQEMEADPSGNINTALLFDGVSNEWIFKLSDRETGWGTAVYLESEFKPDELELEAKFLLDKKMGDWAWVFNLVAEPEYHLTDNTSAFTFTPSTGLAYFLNGHFSIGVEAQDVNFYQGDNWALSESILSLGPVLSYAGNNWWTTLTVLPQLTDLKNGGLNLSDSQRWQIRLGTSFTI